MQKDWKDALSALRNDLGEPEPDTSIDREEEKPNSPEQKTPFTIVTDKKGRNGKIATIIEGFTLPQDQVEELARKLKKQLGVGGSVRDGEILIQGDHKEAVKKFLSSLNYKTRG